MALMTARRRLLVLGTAIAIAAGVAAAVLAQGGGGSQSVVVPSVARDEGGGEAPPAARYGVAGLIPPNWPAPSDDDWAALFAGLADYGGLVGVFTNWSDSPASEGAIPESVQLAYVLETERGITPVIALGAARDLHPGVAPTVDWDDAEQRARFLDAVTAVAATHRPAFLAIGGEVNRLWEADPEAFDGFVAGYRDAYAAIKAVSPETQVFTIFQLEMMKGEALLMGGSETREPQWHLVDRFAGTLDLVGFTTYPFLDYTEPSANPSDYFAEAAQRTGLPVAFTEVGWPSAPFDGAAAPYGGSPEEQVAFVKRFFELTAFGTVFGLWAFPHDVGPGVPEVFSSVSLRSSDGTPKPAFDAWAAGP